MEAALKLFAAGVASAIACACVRSCRSALAPVLAVTAAAVLAAFALRLLDPVVEYLQTLRADAGVETALFAPLLRTGGIGLITELACAFCAETGEQSIGRVLEFGGCAAALCALLPLLETVLGFVRPYLGG